MHTIEKCSTYLIKLKDSDGELRFPNLSEPCWCIDDIKRGWMHRCDACWWGTTEKIHIESPEKCDTCKGTGRIPALTLEGMLDALEVTYPAFSLVYAGDKDPPYGLAIYQIPMFVITGKTRLEVTTTALCEAVGGQHD